MQATSSPREDEAGSFFKCDGWKLVWKLARVERLQEQSNEDQ